MKKLIRKLSVMFLASLLIVAPSFGGIFDSGNKGNIFPSDTFDSLTLADDGWIGLGATKCRIVFNDTTIDEASLTDCFVQIGDGTFAWSNVSAAGDVGIEGALEVDGAVDLGSTLIVADSITIIDDKWLGLGAAKGRIEFDDQATDEINFLDVNIGIGTSTPSGILEVTRPVIAGADGRAQLISKVVLQGTGALTNGTTNTAVGYIDATPVGEWTGIDGDVVTSADGTYYKEGTESLKVAIAEAASAGDTILNPLTSGDENWSARESVGVWVYTDVVLSTGDFDFRITDSIAGNTDTDIPAVTINVWTWVEIDISGVADVNKDVITDIAFVMTVDKGEINIYFDFLAKWDAADETAFDRDILKDGMLGVIANPVASGTAMAWISQTEYTDYFINYAASGNGNLIVITDESLNSFVMQYAYEG